MSSSAPFVTRALATAAAALLLVGWSSSGSSDSGSDGGSDASSSYPITVKTATGTTEIPTRPERVVTLGNPAFENVLTLGIDPVGASAHDIDTLPYLADHVDDEAIDDGLADPYANEINYEAILALEPDLIVAPSWPQFSDETVVQKLEQIAPTLVFDMHNTDNDWQTGIEQVAEAFDEKAKGEELVETAVQEFEDVGAEHSELAKSPYSFGLYYNSDVMLASAGNVLQLLGMKPAADQRKVEDEQAQTVYSGETVGDVKGDLVLLLPSPRSSMKTLESAPAWKGNLDDRVVWLSDAQGEAINNAGILGKTWVPEDLGKTLAKRD